MLVIVGTRPGQVRVEEKGTGRTVAEDLASIEAARDWINGNECSACGGLLFEGAECAVPHFADGRGALSPKPPIGCSEDEPTPVPALTFEPDEDTPIPYTPPASSGGFSFDD